MNVALALFETASDGSCVYGTVVVRSDLGLLKDVSFCGMALIDWWAV